MLTTNIIKKKEPNHVQRLQVNMLGFLENREKRYRFGQLRYTAMALPL